MSSEPRPILLTVACAGVLLGAGCESSRAYAPGSESSLVLHAVLSSRTPYQEFLLERTWDGKTPVTWKDGRSYLPWDPIRTGGGRGEARADIELTTPGGEVLQAVEVQSGMEEASGIYIVDLHGQDLVPGGRYAIRVRTVTGDVVTSETTAPFFLPMASLGDTVFDPVHDTLRVEWDAVPGARAYEVMIENPDTRFRIFTESTFVRFSGDLRDITTLGLPRVFRSGRNVVWVQAVDSNYFDYYRVAGLDFYRSSGNEQSDVRGRSRISGGLGVFGVATTVARRRVQVVSQ